MDGSTCILCSACHTPAETGDRTYLAKYDRVKHRTTHFPSLTATLAPEQKLAWGTTAHLRLRNNEVAVTSNTGKDVVVFPAGYMILLNRQRLAQLIALPPAGAEVPPLRKKDGSGIPQ